MPFPPRPEPSFEEDYDDGDPYSCMAAGAAGVPSKIDALRVQVEKCYGRSQEKLQEFIDADRRSTLTALWEIWNNDRNLATRPNHGRAEWAVKQSALLGNTSLAEYERNSKKSR